MPCDAKGSLCEKMRLGDNDSELDMKGPVYKERVTTVLGLP